MALSLARARAAALFAHGGHGAVERAVAVGGVVGRRTGRSRVAVAVQPAFERAEDEAEQEVAPGGLGEGAAVAGERDVSGTVASQIPSG